METKLFFRAATFYWNCFTCGCLNTVEIDDRGYVINDFGARTNKVKVRSITNLQLEVSCQRCKTKRSGVVEFSSWDKESRMKRLRQIEKRYFGRILSKTNKKGRKLEKRLSRGL
jgi:hypothetical protein